MRVLAVLGCLELFQQNNIFCSEMLESAKTYGLLVEILKKGSQTPKHQNRTELSQTGLHTLAVRGLGVLFCFETVSSTSYLLFENECKKSSEKYGILFEMLG